MRASEPELEDFEPPFLKISTNSKSRVTLKTRLPKRE
jgi:hypothetical protein